jgi:4-amino-4-deoxy-L-arabinose transferase-like glycosyltransferase
MKNIHISLHYALVFALALLLFLPFIGNVHLFDWDEINFAECAREMILTQNYLQPSINFEPFWEKPPLFIWFQVLSMQIFGVNEFAARFPNVIAGALTLLSIFHIGRKLYDVQFGWFWVMAYTGALLPHLYFKSGIIDPFFNLFIFLALAFIIESEGFDAQNSLPSDEEPQRKPISRLLILGGILAGLAVLTKGPVALLIIGLTWLAKQIVYKELSLKRLTRFVVFNVVALLVAASWFVILVVQNGTWFVESFLDYNIRLAQTKDSGHGGFIGYHVVVLLLGCFPTSLFALRSLRKKYNFYGEKSDMTRWMKILFWVVLILFSLVQTKIVHYSSMAYFPISFLGAICIKGIFEDQYVYASVRWWLLATGSLIGLVVAITPFLGLNIDVLRNRIDDVFVKKILEADVYWSGWEVAPGVIAIFLVVIFASEVRKIHIVRGLVLLFVGMILLINLILWLFVGRIERYSQRAAIDFYQAHQAEDCYIEPVGFKSYAHLFYGQKRKPVHPQHADEDWILKGQDIDKPAYVVAKIMQKEHLNTLPTLVFLYEKNGFVFYKRK